MIGANFLKFLLIFLLGCTPDYSVVEIDKTQVIIDSIFQVEEIGELDILIVLDTSGSMTDDATLVGTGIELFRKDIEGLTMQYRFGFITTDENRLSYSGPYDSTSSSIDLTLAPTLLDPAYKEAGFQSAYVFLNSEDGLNFRRTSADFLLFLISDEEEQSSISAALFHEWLHDFFKDTLHDAVAITTLEGSTCGVGGSYGYKYIELASLYNKDALNICDENWEIWLADSSFLTHMISEIELSYAPIADSIIVYIDEVITNDWQYNENKNVVKLNFVPDYGSLIEVGYKIIQEE